MYRFESGVLVNERERLMQIVELIDRWAYDSRADSSHSTVTEQYAKWKKEEKKQKPVVSEREFTRSAEYIAAAEARLAGQAATSQAPSRSNTSHYGDSRSTLFDQSLPLTANGHSQSFSYRNSSAAAPVFSLNSSAVANKTTAAIIGNRGDKSQMNANPNLSFTSTPLTSIRTRSNAANESKRSEYRPTFGLRDEHLQQSLLNDSFALRAREDESLQDSIRKQPHAPLPSALRSSNKDSRAWNKRSEPADSTESFSIFQRNPQVDPSVRWLDQQTSERAPLRRQYQ